MRTKIFSFVTFKQLPATKIATTSKLPRKKLLTRNLEHELIGAYLEIVTFGSLNTRLGLYNLDERGIVCASLNLLSTHEHITYT